MSRFIFILFFLLPEAAPRGDLAAVGRRDDAVVGCGPAAMTAPQADASGRYAPVFPGWGHYHYSISTTDDSAQFYFDQGLSLYYSYHLTEAVASFKEAAVKDGNCAMVYWGQALAMGPYYNIAYVYRMPARILPVLNRMNELAPAATPREKDLIAVLNLRYSTDTTDSRRSALNRNYSEGMKSLITRYPCDKDIKVLYIDGMMTEHAWDMWDTAGKARPWTPELVRYCEEVLAADPYHPAALHYHIHLLEASPHPEETLASAEKLKDLMPGVAHMVHMASHSYQRTGEYAKGVVVNEQANAAHKQYAALAPQLHLPSDIFHYDAVEAVCAMNGAMYGKAVESAEKCRAEILLRPGQPNNNLQYLATMPLFVDVRFGKWQAILDRPLPDSRWVYAALLSDFARGMAWLHKGHPESAQRCLDSLKAKLGDPSLQGRTPPFNPAIKGGSVAEGILEGEILFAQQRQEAAMTVFSRAMECEDGMSYLEPKEWQLATRHYAGVCLLHVGKAREAEKLYREDLRQNPGNGWALLGVALSLKAQGKIAAADYMAKAKLAFAHAEEMPKGSAY